MEDNLYILVLTSYVCFCGRVVTASFDCTFDEGLCSWQQVKGDDFNWKLIVHNISQNEWTQSHHTPGAGGYMYINSTNRKANEYARLVSPRKSAGRHCLSFWYYMKGDNKLCIKIKEGTQERLLSSITYNSSMWLVKQLNLTAKKRFKIFIDGMFINIDTFGEIAFDDIKLFSGKCPLGCKDPALEFGREMSKDYKIGSTVNISCISGYRLEGDSVIHCLTNGSWNYRPKCLPVDCNMPPLAREMISNISEGTTYNKTIRLGCSEGYTLVGNATITCQADGNWTVMPSCIVNSCKDPTPEFGTLMNKDFEIGSTVNISCMSGYKLKGNAKIDCLSNGSWSCRPICLPVDCSDPTPFSGSVSSNNFTYQSSIEVKCDPGYMLKGHSQITCQANSTWSEIPECDIINCNDPTPMAGIISSKNFTYQTVIKVKCNLGYTLKGHSQITCQDNSSWSDKPVCDQNNCSRPILSDGLYVDQSNSTPYSGVISLACADGYKMNGNSTVFCLDNHTWTLFPTCTEAVLPSDAFNDKYIGCLEDNKIRVLDGKMKDLDPNGRDECKQFCQDYRYFGIESGEECFCGNKILRYKYASKCDTECEGNSDEKCGGHWQIAIYDTWHGSTSSSGKTSITTEYTIETRSITRSQAITNDDSIRSSTTDLNTIISTTDDYIITSMTDDDEKISTTHDSFTLSTVKARHTSADDKKTSVSILYILLLVGAGLSCIILVTVILVIIACKERHQCKKDLVTSKNVTNTEPYNIVNLCPSDDVAYTVPYKTVNPSPANEKEIFSGASDDAAYTAPYSTAYLTPVNDTAPVNDSEINTGNVYINKESVIFNKSDESKYDYNVVNLRSNNTTSHDDAYDNLHEQRDCYQDDSFTYNKLILFNNVKRDRSELLYDQTNNALTEHKTMEHSVQVDKHDTKKSAEEKNEGSVKDTIYANESL